LKKKGKKSKKEESIRNEAMDGNNNGGACKPGGQRF
jgi:hypothetical protein